MAGESITLVTEYPDDFIVHTYPCVVSAADAAIFYCDRTMVVDSFTITVSTAAVASTIQLKAVAPGTDPTAANIAAGTSVSDAVSIAALGVVSATVNQTENILPVGTVLGIDYTGSASGFRGLVTVRLRSRMK